MAINPVLPEHVDEWVRLYEAGSSITEIAKPQGRSLETVWTWLRKRGVEIRPRSIATTPVKVKFDRRWKIDPVQGCWLWTRSPMKAAGYGRIRAFGECLAHRVSYILHKGPIPEDLQVLHRCDVRLCVNPDHLFVGTQKDNMEDCSKKGRIQRHHALKTHCPSGHPYSGSNLYITKSGTRQCRTCARKRDERRRNIHASSNSINQANDCEGRQ